MRNLYRLLCCPVLLLGLASLVWGQADQTLRATFHPMDINVQSPFAAGLQHWYLPLSPLVGNNRWYSLIGANHGTLTGTGASPTSGWGPTLRPGGEAQLNFDGVDDYVSTSVNAGVTPSSPAYTLCVWALPTVGTGKRVLIQTAPEGQISSEFDPYNGVWFLLDTLQVQTGLILDPSNQKYIAMVGAIPLNTWSHLCATHDGTATTAGLGIWVNGMAQSTTVINDFGTVTSITDRPWRIGTDTMTPPVNYFQGAIGEVLVWSRTLRAAEIATLYQQSRLGYPTFLNTPSLSSLAVAVGAPATSVNRGRFFPFFQR